MSKLIIIIIIAIIAGAFYLEKRRGNNLSSVASRLGFTFFSGQHKLPDELGEIGFDLFTQGPPNIQNRMTGYSNDREMTIFDFSYIATEGDEGINDIPVGDEEIMETRNQSVIWVRQKKVLPDFDFSPKRIHKRTVGARFGLTQVTLDGQNNFNRQYTLLGRDTEKLRQLFSQQLIDQLAARPNLVIESRGQDLLFYRFAQRHDPKVIPGFLQEVETLLELL
ncbi:MAG: hypothetical protein ABW148_02930 [Sedimenticola sp.]